MAIEVRATRPEEYRAASDTVSAALLFPPNDDESWEGSRASWDESSSVSAWDGTRCVGHAAQFFVDTTVPGGNRVLTGAVTRVGVLPTHRRRGVASSLMKALTADALEQHAVLMSLRATEAVIYGRYGYGVAGEYTEVAIDSARARPISGAAKGGSIRLLRPEEILDTARPIYAAAAHRRPGIVSRPESWWKRYLGTALTGSKSSYVVAHVDSHGIADGYAHYEVAWNEAGSGGVGEVHDIVGATDAVELALWAFVLDIDLVRTWKADERPVDDVLRAAVADRRAYATKSVDDEQWMRIIDAEAALAARTYNEVTGSVTIMVTDAHIADNNGTWIVDARGVERTDNEPDLAVDIGVLSAAYLGGPAWHALAAAGSVEVRNDKAVTIADNLFASRPLPFSGSFF